MLFNGRGPTEPIRGSDKTGLLASCRRGDVCRRTEIGKVVVDLMPTRNPVCVEFSTYPGLKPERGCDSESCACDGGGSVTRVPSAVIRCQRASFVTTLHGAMHRRTRRVRREATTQVLDSFVALRCDCRFKKLTFNSTARPIACFRLTRDYPHLRIY